jgi:cyclic-di-AMP phosphodiesterase PgpH
MALDHQGMYQKTERGESPAGILPSSGRPRPQILNEKDRVELAASAGVFLVGASMLLLSRPIEQVWRPTALLSVLIIPALIISIIFSYVLKWQPEEMRSLKNLRILVILILLISLICRMFQFLTDAIHRGFPSIPSSSLEYAIPVALIGVLLAVIFNPRMAFAGSLGTIILFCFVSSRPFDFFLVSFLGSLIGILTLIEPQERASILKAGGVIGVANVGSILLLAFFQQRMTSLPFDVLCGAINGILVGILALGLLPPLEYLLGITTNFKLLELSNLHQQILRQLILAAPGTYHHSVVLGTLAEAAAQAIGANSLLVRVSAYYHDIGKIKKAEYFVENQMAAVNRHEKLSPPMSSLILTSHVKEGVELARQNKLPLPIVDIIKQHHGTCLITYFYRKAKESGNPKESEIREEDYRYPGPKPQTKEAAIVMLADAVEAASRTLNEPTPARIQGLVQRIINHIFVDGQLEECDLTLKDLHQITKAFVRILTGIFHHRIQYPGFNFDDLSETRGDNGNLGQKSTKENRDQPKPSQKGYPEDIRGLGLQ